MKRSGRDLVVVVSPVKGKVKDLRRVQIALKDPEEGK